MKVLLVKPLEKPKVVNIKRGLESLQKAVEGYIQATYPFEDPVAVILNEEGKLDGSMPNRAMRDAKGDIYDIYFGNFLITGIGESDFCSLTEEQISKYEKLVSVPEIFIRNEEKIIAFPVDSAAGKSM